MQAIRKCFTGTASALALVLSGCAAVPDARQVVMPKTASALGLAGGELPAVADDWWREFRDPQLDRIMADALAGSPRLDAASARVRVAEAEIQVERAALRPQVAADVQETRQRLSDKYTVPPPYAGTSRWVGTTQATFGWALDLAGRQKALVEQAGSSAEAFRLDASAARIALSGAVAQTYVNLARANALVAIADRFVASREQSLRLARSLQRNRLGSDFDLRSAEVLLAEARQAAVQADGQRRLMVHALAALAGRGSDYYASIRTPALDLDRPIAVPSSLPADLLARRPDILAAQMRIEAADADRRVARADFYPNVDLRAFAGVSAIGLGSLFTGGAATYGVGPAVHLPIFEGGRLRARYRGAVGRTDVAIADYNEVVVRSVREVADALSSIDTNAAATARQTEIARGLSETVRLDQVRVRTGLGASLDVLDAQDRVLTAGQRLADLKADGLVARVQLIAALGGGFVPGNSDRTAPADGIRITGR